MQITFDFAKDVSNQAKHGISLAMAAEIEWDDALSAMPKLKPGTIIPTTHEDAAIQRGIDADPDTMEFGATEARRAKRMGRPPLEAPKVSVTVRYDQDIIDAFRATGDGWQTRMNAALREWLRDHEIA